MLDRLSKRVLTYMSKNTKGTNGTKKKFFTFATDLDLMANALKTDKEEVRAAIRYLREQGYISTDRNFFHLDHKGFRFSEMSRIEFYDFMRKSVLTPIIVSFITSVLTTNLWPSLWRWLQTMLSRIQ